MATLDIRSLTKSFGDTRVIKGVDLRVEDHEFCVFLGPSGCGKSTLLRLIAGLEEATAGEILLDGKPITDLPPARRNLAMVFQSYALYPHMTVRQNMSFALDLAKVEPSVIEEKVRRTARILELEPLLDRKPAALSGGQRQRVAIGRAIVREPRIFLFDEPLSNLDASLRAQMRLEIARLHQEFKATMIYVTHDQVEAMTLADKVVLFNGGNIEQRGSPQELYHRPVNRFVAGFLGTPQMAFLEATQQGDSLALANGKAIAAPTELKRQEQGRGVTIGVRPEQLTLAEAGQGTLDGRIEVIERLGSDAYVYLTIPNLGRLTVRCPGDLAATEGSTAAVVIKSNGYHVFDADGVALFHPQPS
ncbi:sn-glycerol-3-phosphate ABC transporter ATP-binding protein UgpC [Stigmatella sp. ncwal1]|uniref:Sn-glycerol-3-phosphate ABC transporter ATP-binding protein UgpC n=1 Tax=Stigmatella ashevillensis TaxID=2995309 RepID=A0ABT5DJI2_9BACT|nr:sn-glycerol-3-phosphate ABC transporter ATP-binding protein UgpC [Stigmatella ashevillena]MDC0713817.1 sn-glycerol-3-phosphate ABC transporter ATP-binding protein UgpC [Stigmatella ashevillena]